MTDSPCWHTKSTEQIARELGSDSNRGLAEAEAIARLAKDGPNVLPESKGPGMLQLFLGQFRNLVIWVLIAASGVSALLGERLDAIAILAIVFLNAGIGFFQEYSAEKSITALRRMSAPSARVRRDGIVRIIPALEVVRGDLIEFDSGDLIPADARLIGLADLRCLESVLTGESETVEKTMDSIPAESLAIGDRRNMAFMGTSVAAGTGRALVVGTGRSTEIGRIASLLETAAAEEATPLQRRLDRVGRTLVWVSLGLVSLLFLLGVLRGMEPFELLITSISLAVAAAPEGLPAVVTVALALGVRRMAKQNALVRRLPSVETLGSANVICTDKTGTLTAGEMTVKELFLAGEFFQVEGVGFDPVGRVHSSGHSPDGIQSERLLDLASILAGTLTAEVIRDNGRWKVIGDPTEGALLTLARKLGHKGREQAELFAYPFDSERKRASVIRRETDGKVRILVNGAPDVLLELCSRFLSAEGPRILSASDRRLILEANAAMAGKGLRVIGSAYRFYDPNGDRKPSSREVEHDLIFAGLAGMQDPLRPEARKAVAKCRDAGIRVVMITGDHPITAKAIGKELGILEGFPGVLTGNEVAGLDNAGFADQVENIGIYARVSAEHKLRIVNAWKAKGAVVAMTGDGVNDAPALKGAHIGVAMGRTGTDVTKQASDMIIVDDNFASIVAAVEEGRGVYQNIRNTLQFLLGGNAGELLLMTAAILSGLPTPLLAVHLLWVNLITDGLPALCLAAERIDPDVMKRPPMAQSEILSDRRFRNTLLLTAALTAGTVMAVFLWAKSSHSLEEARSFAFATLVFAELFRSFGTRNEGKPIWKLGPLGNLSLSVVVLISIGLQFLFHNSPPLRSLLKTSPLTLSEGISLLAVSSIPLIVLELRKVATSRARRLG